MIGPPIICCHPLLKLTRQPQNNGTIRPGRTLRIYIDNVTLTSQKPCQHNNKFECRETNRKENDIAIFYWKALSFFSVACLELVDNDDKISQDPWKSVTRADFCTIRVSDSLDPDQARFLSGLIWVQTDCKGYQQMTKHATSRQKCLIQNNFLVLLSG